MLAWPAAAAATRLCFAALALAAGFVACGSRTGLLVPDGTGPLFDGGPTDAQVDCASPSTCEATDPSYVYRCGQRVYQCSSLEQCREGGGGDAGAACVNPCLDSLGNDTSNGCEFYAVEMDTTAEVAGSCYAVFIVNQWKTGEPAKITVELGGQALPLAPFTRIPSGHGVGVTYQPFDASKGLPRDEIAVLFLSRDPGAVVSQSPADPRVLARCPDGVVPAVQADAALHGTGKASAFHIKTNVPVVAYQMLPYGGGSARVTGATLLLPTSAWGTNYVVANAYQAPSPAMIAEARAGPTAVIIASEDQTQVWLRPTADVIGQGGVADAPAGVSTRYALSRGQYLQVTQQAELTGTAIESDKAVAVIGGSTLVDLPLDRRRADTAEQMLPPVQALGHEYAAVRYRSRDPVSEESVPWRLVGVAAGTQLTYEPAAPQGAPATLDAQQRVEFSSPGPFVVRSQDAQHPFFMASYMTGGQPYDGAGDPDFVNVVPPAQYLPRYTFFTDPTYPETNLVVVRARDAQSGQMPDVALDCAGVLGGWQPVGTGGAYELTRVDLSTGDFHGVGACDNGVHVIASPSHPATARFGVTVWGWGSGATWGPDDETNPRFTRWVSYGYPAGANFAPLNTAVLRAR